MAVDFLVAAVAVVAAAAGNFFVKIKESNDLFLEYFHHYEYQSVEAY